MNITYTYIIELNHGQQVKLNYGQYLSLMDGDYVPAHELQRDITIDDVRQIVVLTTEVQTKVLYEVADVTIDYVEKRTKLRDRMGILRQAINENREYQNSYAVGILEELLDESKTKLEDLEMKHNC